MTLLFMTKCTTYLNNSSYNILYSLRLVTKPLSNLKTTWFVASYADAYWFLYTNRNSLYQWRYL